MTAKPIRILIVDDHQIMRQGLRLMLKQQPNVQVVGEAGDGETALHQVEQLQPDVILMDIELPDADGVDLSRTILQRQSHIRVVILSAVANQETLDRALEAGVSGYLLKLNTAEELVRAIQRATPNEPYLSPEVSAVLVKGYQRLRNPPRTEDPSNLSERECEVLRLIAEGRNTKEAAAALSLSVKTVETHRVRIMNKLGLHSVAELTKYAVRMGYTTL